MSKNSKKKEIFVRVCPRCGSKNIGTDPSIYGAVPFYICKSCGFGSPLFPKINLKEAKKIKNKPINYSPTFAPTLKPISFEIIFIGIAIFGLLIIIAKLLLG